MWENGEYLPVILNRIPKKKEDDKINIVCCDAPKTKSEELNLWQANKKKCCTQNAPITIIVIISNGNECECDNFYIMYIIYLWCMSNVASNQNTKQPLK